MLLKKQIFVEEYLKSRNARKAAVAAGYSPKTAKQQGCRLLKEDEEVKAAIKRAFSASEAIAGMTAQKLAQEVWKIKEIALEGDAPNAGAAMKGMELIYKFLKLDCSQTEQRNYTFKFMLPPKDDA